MPSRSAVAQCVSLSARLKEGAYGPAVLRRVHETFYRMTFPTRSLSARIPPRKASGGRPQILFEVSSTRFKPRRTVVRRTPLSRGVSKSTSEFRCFSSCTPRPLPEPCPRDCMPWWCVCVYVCTSVSFVSSECSCEVIRTEACIPARLSVRAICPRFLASFALVLSVSVPVRPSSCDSPLLHRCAPPASHALPTPLVTRALLCSRDILLISAIWIPEIPGARPGLHPSANMRRPQ